MTRPLLISDCDEVLLHMVQHFKDWLHEAHEIDFALGRPDFSSAMRDKDDQPLEQERMWALLNSFFDTEMQRQTLVPHVLESLGKIGEVADIVILTNLMDCHREGRIEQLAAHGIHHHVICNQGGKGARVHDLITEYAPSSAVFVDDLHIHHESVAKRAPEVWRLHMISEPLIAGNHPKAEHAHARIDTWPEAADWIFEHFGKGRAA